MTGYPSHAPGCSKGKEAGPALNLTSSQPTQQPNAAEVGIAAEVGNAPRDPASASAPTGSDAVVDVEMTAGISDAGSPDAAGHGAVHGPNPNHGSVGNGGAKKEMTIEAQERARSDGLDPKAGFRGIAKWPPDHACAL